MARQHLSAAQRSVASAQRGIRRDARRRERETMTPAEAEARARRLIRQRFERDGDEAEIGMEDFKRDNLPMQLVTQALVSRLIQAVRTDLQMERA